MRNPDLSRPRAVLATLAVAAALAGCNASPGDDASAAAPAVTAPAAASAPDSPDADVRFLSGTTYAATGAQAEIALAADDERAGDVLQRIATASGVRLDNADGVSLDHRVSMNFDGAPLATVLSLLGQEVGAEITAETDAIRVRPQASAGQ